MTKNFPALPHVYKLLYLYLEPLSTFAPVIITWFYPGAAWFHHQLVPSNILSPPEIPNARDHMAVLQLANCYLLIGLTSSLVFRAVRDNLKHDLKAQESIVKAMLIALAIADLTHVVVTVLALPASIAHDPWVWNATTHGNITSVIVLFLGRMAWLAGIGRPTFDKVKPGSQKQRLE